MNIFPCRQSNQFVNSMIIFHVFQNKTQAGVATSAAKESNVSRLSGGSDMRSTPGIVFQMQELAPPSSATKHRGGKSHADIVKKAERNRAKELKEAAKKHKEEAARRERRAERDRQKKKRVPSLFFCYEHIF